MKKLVTLMLCLTLVLGLCACGGGEAAADTTAAATQSEGGLQAGQLLVGYGKVNITPELSLPLGGYGNTHLRMSEGFMDYLYATCVAITDAQGNSAVLFGIDMISSAPALYKNAREEIAKEFGIPPENIMISASHNHSSPDMGSSLPEVGKWAPQLKDLLVDCARQAMEDRAPADLYMASTQTEGLNFVRRYEVDAGGVCGYQSLISLYGWKVVDYESEADRELQLVKFDRREKADILLANFQTHPHRGGSASNPLMTADLVGAFRTELEEKAGYNVVYFTGGSGNINPTSPIKEHNATNSFQEQGKMLAKYAMDAEPNYEKISGGPVRGMTTEFESMIDHTEDHLLSYAREASELWKECNDIQRVATEYLPFGINGPYHAGAIVTKASLGKSNTFTVGAISFGDVGVAVAPYEMFDTNGVFIKENSPFKLTLVATCANGANGYFPSEFAWDNGGYEVDTCKYMKGTAEALADRFVEMLTELSK